MVKLISRTLLTKTSKFLSFVLRHDPQAIGLTLDSEGWADLETLIAAATKHGHTLDRTLIFQVVSTCEKKRFSLSSDGISIRAAQGHSTSSVAIEFAEKLPPHVLYHGTAQRFMESILKEGLKPGARQYVHLSEDMGTATSVGSRYGSPVVLAVAAQAMHAQGLKFFQAENGVWLTPSVPVEFITVPAAP